MNYNKKILKQYKDTEEPKGKYLRQVVEFIDEKGNSSEISIKNFKPKLAKRGWSRMYSKDYYEIMDNVVSKNAFAFRVFGYLVKNGYLKKDGTIKKIKQVELAKDFNTTRQRISRALKVLKDNEAIAEINGELRYNPFMLGVPNQSDEEITLAQIEWEKEIGHYNFYK